MQKVILLVVLLMVSSHLAANQTICHFPPGNPENFHTIVVSDKAAATHLEKHGDYAGACGEVVCPCGGLTLEDQPYGPFNWGEIITYADGLYYDCYSESPPSIKYEMENYTFSVQVDSAATDGSGFCVIEKWDMGGARARRANSRRSGCMHHGITSNCSG